MKRIITILLLCIMCASLSAQQTVGRTMRSKKEPAQQLFESMLPSTARVMVIDSVICSRSEMLDVIPQHVSVGKLTMQRNDTATVYSMEDEFTTRRFISSPVADGTNRLFMSEKIDGQWTEPQQVELEGGFTDIISPVLFCDGITLYFAAKGGSDNLGGYDIYSTIYDAEDETFLKPQNMGLPYNSFDDDIFYLHDDYNELAWLVTTRGVGEESDKVCVYTLVPTETRETYTDVTSLDELAALAMLSDISLTQKDKNELTRALKHLKKLKKHP